MIEWLQGNPCFFGAPHILLQNLHPLFIPISDVHSLQFIQYEQVCHKAWCFPILNFCFCGVIAVHMEAIEQQIVKHHSYVGGPT